MNHTSIRLRAKQGIIKRKSNESDCLSTFNLLTNDLLFDEVERLLPSHRERLFPPTETLAMFVTQAMSADRSCQHIVNQAAIQRVVTGLPTCSTQTGGYCKARQRLPTEMVRNLALFVGRQVDHQAQEKWRWRGRRVRLVDGTTVTLPDTPSNQSVYPQQGSQKPGLGFPICRVVGITCLSSGALLNAAVGRFNGKGGDEQTLLRSIEQTLDKGDILLGDAFFSTFFFIVSMKRQGVDILMEQLGARKRSRDFRKGIKLGQRDHLVVIDKPKKKPHWMSEKSYQKAPDSITVREFKAGGKIMVTTMTCAKEASKESLKSLYKQRWSVELDIRNIKETMGMNVLSCKSPEMALKEIWIYLLAYNLIRLLMVQSANANDMRPREISFKHCLQIWLTWSHQVDTSDDNQLIILFELMAQQRVGQRPGRIEPRAVKRRPKAYPLLTLPRPLARENVTKYGHPKKLK